MIRYAWRANAPKMRVTTPSPQLPTAPSLVPAKKEGWMGTMRNTKKHFAYNWTKKIIFSNQYLGLAVR
jgi:hypothetical protein